MAMLGLVGVSRIPTHHDVEILLAWTTRARRYGLKWDGICGVPQALVRCSSCLGQRLFWRGMLHPRV